MPGTNEAFTLVKIDAQLKDHLSEALRKAEAVFQSLLARTFSSNQFTEGAMEEAAFA